MTIFAPNLLAGKTALVTGGGSGIGAGIARLFAAHGAKLALVGRKKEKLDAVAETIGASVHPCDVRDYAALETAVNEAAARHGSLDVVVNGAAGNFLAPAATLSANGFRSVVDIDLCGTFNTCRASFSHLAKKGGCIVNITATQAATPTPLQVHAGAAKAGIEKLTRDLALEWAGSGIRVVAVAPGPVEGTEGMARLAPGTSGDNLKKRVPLGRYATIDEIASSVLFVVCAGYVTGSTLLIDGGTSLIGPGPFLDLMG